MPFPSPPLGRADLGKVCGEREEGVVELLLLLLQLPQPPVAVPTWPQGGEAGRGGGGEGRGPSEAGTGEEGPGRPAWMGMGAQASTAASSGSEPASSGPIGISSIIAAGLGHPARSGRRKLVTVAMDRWDKRIAGNEGRVRNEWDEGMKIGPMTSALPICL